MATNPNNKIIHQLFSQLKAIGYQVVKDDLGYYLTNGEKKFSIMFCGPLFNGFFNKLIQNSWVLQTKKNNFISLADALMWVIRTHQTL
jgi:hypothetical protein